MRGRPVTRNNAVRSTLSRSSRPRAPSTSTASPEAHIPIMVPAIVSLFRGVSCPKPVFLDCTFGLGGHTTALLQEIPTCTVVAIDQDEEAVARSKPLRKQFGERLRFVRGNFADMAALLPGLVVDGVLMDLGVSSMQLSTAKRGFSIRAEYEGPLDMRMDSTGPITAADAVNLLTEDQLKRLIRALGDEPRAASVARAIATLRKSAPLTRTSELIDAVVRGKGQSSRDQIHPATQTFQALRMFVNDELGSLRRALVAAEERLSSGGALALLTFHSGEARVWKDVLRCNRANKRESSFAQAGIALPSADEVQRNPRARSAHLRHALRTSSPPVLAAADFAHSDETTALFTHWREQLVAKLSGKWKR